MNWFDHADAYKVAYMRAGFYGWLVALGWVVLPFAVATVLHPSDAILLQYKIQGLRVPWRGFTAQQETVGLIEAVIALAVLVMAQLVGTTLFYRKAQLNGAKVAAPPLWPLAALLAGILGNAAWVLAGHFDIGGCLAGCSSAALTVGAEMVVEKLGREFVCGVASSGQFSVPQLQQFPAAQSGQTPLLYSESGQGPVHYHIPD